MKNLIVILSIVSMSAFAGARVVTETKTATSKTTATGNAYSGVTIEKKEAARARAKVKAIKAVKRKCRFANQRMVTEPQITSSTCTAQDVSGNGAMKSDCIATATLTCESTYTSVDASNIPACNACK